MLVSARTTFALRCPRCGKIELIPLSRFAIGRSGSLKFSCSCGSHMLTAGVKRGQVWLQVPCYLCDGVHFMYYVPQDFWSGVPTPMTCAETDLQLGVFGEGPEVENYAHPGLDRWLEDAAFDDYFDHREVMHQAVNRLQALLEAGDVQCTCGGQGISMGVFPDLLELTCEECGRRKSILAGTPEDLDTLERTGRIEISGDAPSRRKGHKK